jgi:Phosphodiester glycosidase
MARRFLVPLSATALFTGALLLPAVGPSAAANRYTIGLQSSPAPGLTYTRIVDSVGPNRIFVLTVDPSTQMTVDVALAGDQLGHFEKTSSMASRHKAIAAVNGDFGLSPGYPVDGYAEDGDFKISRTILGTNFAVSQDEQDLHMSSSTFVQTLEEVDSNEHWRISSWNYAKPEPGQITGYTPAGGDFAKPAGRSCYAQLATSGGLMWSSTGTAVVQTYTVRAAACQRKALSPQYGATLVAVPGTPDADELTTLTTGETVRVSWSFGWRGVVDVLGGYPRLLHDGTIEVGNCSSSLCQRNPRTGVGWTADGKILMVVVDGRQSGYSVGMTLLEFAQAFQYLGAVTAMNLDGGGSSTMVVKGIIRNRPSDGFERAVSTSLLALNGPDVGEPVPGPWGSVTTAGATGSPTAGTAGADWGTMAALDGGSTGGMAEALAEGSFGRRPVTLPPDLQEALRLFRSRSSSGVL